MTGPLLFSIISFLFFFVYVCCLRSCRRLSLIADEIGIHTVLFTIRMTVFYVPASPAQIIDLYMENPIHQRFSARARENKLKKGGPPRPTARQPCNLLRDGNSRETELERKYSVCSVVFSLFLPVFCCCLSSFHLFHPAPTAG